MIEINTFSNVLPFKKMAENTISINKQLRIKNVSFAIPKVPAISVANNNENRRSHSESDNLPIET